MSSVASYAFCSDSASRLSEPLLCPSAPATLSIDATCTKSEEEAGLSGDFLSSDCTTRDAVSIEEIGRICCRGWWGYGLIIAMAYSSSVLVDARFYW